MSGTNSRPLRATAVLAELARRGIETNREALVELTDRLGLPTRTSTPTGGLGNRRWTSEQLDVVAAAFRLRDRHGLPIETIDDVLHGRTQPQRLVAEFAETLELLHNLSAA